MFQRIQTVFLLLTAAAMAVASVTPLAFLFFEGRDVAFEAMGVYRDGMLSDSTWGLFVIGCIGSVLPLVTVFLYKKRMVQIRLSIFNLIVMIGFYLYFAFLLFKLLSVQGMQFQKIGIGIIMPVIAIILTSLAIRKIGADETLVRSLNRLRR